MHSSYYLIESHNCNRKITGWEVNLIGTDAGTHFWVIDRDSAKSWVERIKFCPWCNEKLVPVNTKIGEIVIDE